MKIEQSKVNSRKSRLKEATKHGSGTPLGRGEQKGQKSDVKQKTLSE